MATKKRAAPVVQDYNALAAVLMGGGGDTGDAAAASDTARAQAVRDNPDAVEANLATTKLRERQRRERLRRLKQQQEEERRRRQQQAAEQARLQDAEKPIEATAGGGEIAQRAADQKVADRKAIRKSRIHDAQIAANIAGTAQGSTQGAVNAVAGAASDAMGGHPGKTYDVLRSEAARLAASNAGQLGTSSDWLAMGLGYQDWKLLVAKNVTSDTQFIDKRGSSIDPKTGAPYTQEDYFNDATANKNELTPDWSTLAGPMFTQRGTTTQVATDQPVPVGQGPAMMNVKGPDEHHSIEEYMAMLTKSARDQTPDLPYIQRLMWEAGLYDSVDSQYQFSDDPTDQKKHVNQPLYGVMDQDTVDALGNLVTQAALATMPKADGGQGLTIEEMLFGLRDARLARFGVTNFDSLVAQNAADKSGGGGGGGGGAPISISDPASVRQLGDSVAQEVYGRRLTEQEAADVAALIRNDEVQRGMAAQGDGGVIESVDPEARIRDYLRNKDAGTSGAHDIAGAFSMFANILGAGLGLGQGFGNSAVGTAGGSGIVGAAPTSGLGGPAAGGGFGG